MKLTKEQVCVFIENEAHLQQAREVLERYGEKINESGFIITSPDHNYMFFGGEFIGCSLSYFDQEKDNLITITELEEILKEEV